MVINHTTTGRGPFKPVIKVDDETFVLDVNFKGEDAAAAKAEIIVHRIRGEVLELLSEEDYERTRI